MYCISTQALSLLEGGVCQLTPGLCLNVLTELAGYNPDNLDESRVPVYLKHTPAGTSTQNMVHWAQV